MEMEDILGGQIQRSLIISTIVDTDPPYNVQYIQRSLIISTIVDLVAPIVNHDPEIPDNFYYCRYKQGLISLNVISVWYCKTAN